MRLPSLLLLAACTALGACNLAVSPEPIFSQDERSPTLSLKEGLWVASDAECDGRPAPPPGEPPCGERVIVRKDGLIISKDISDEGKEPLAYLIVDGDPPIMQVGMHDHDVPPEDKRTIYGFLALKPQKVDSDGKIVALTSWFVLCGPGEGGSKPKEPFPGFDEECRPSSRDALRKAAVMSPGLDAERDDWRWVSANPLR